MELLHRLRTRTARAAVRLGGESGSQTRWAERARIVLYILALALLGWEVYLSHIQGLTPLQTVVRAAAVLTLVGMPRWPLASAAVSIPFLVVEMWVSVDPVSLMIVVPLLMTGLLVATQVRQFGYAYALLMVGALTSLQRTEQPLADLATWLTVFLIPCLLGEGVRFWRSSVEEIRLASQAQLGRQRRDLARELHDTSIHDITAMIMALERAKLVGLGTPKALEEIDHAIAAGRQSVVSMRGVLKILRSEDTLQTRTPDAIPTVLASTSTVQRALEDARQTLGRMGHELRVHLEDQIDLPMPLSVRTALVRVIQECTANMVKYAEPGSPCTVMVERTDTETRALFINDVREGGRVDTALSSGVGLIGARERVEAVGGSLAVRHHDGRWIIQALIPTISSASEGQVERAAQH
ncbi:sensor histidine kinase [Georgenia wutianyii]|nr:histidine kinase [Georgenia wutianyii]